MKKTILFILVFLINTSFFAQNVELWGTTALGGSTNTGTVFRYSVQDDTLISIPLEMPQASTPNLQGFIEASNGKLYALTNTFGYDDNINSNTTGGAIIEFDPSTNNYQHVYLFKNEMDGFEPNYKLMQASNGKLYGMTTTGGAYSQGVIFQFEISNYSYTKLYDFQGSFGSNPVGALIEGTNDILYGTTQSGGTYQKGVLFRFELLDLNYTKVFDFNDSLGNYPSNTLIKVDNSTLIGTTNAGGNDDFGVIYKYDFMVDQYEKVYDFDLQFGMLPPKASIAFDGFNKIYGASWSNPSRIFCFNLSNETMSIVHEFNTVSQGNQPDGGLVFHNGDLYGLCVFGGSNSTGTLYKYSIATDLLTVITHFSQSTSFYYMNSTVPFIASNNLLYGLGTFGGLRNKGGIFKVDLTTSQITNLHDFNYGVNGAIPKSTLFQASNGRVFGSAFYGGLNGEGVVFEVDRFTNEIDTLHNATPLTSNGYTDIMMEYQENLLGTGSNGSIYNFNLNTNEYSEVCTISGTTASGGLTKIEDKVYGVTYSGGANGLGTIYRHQLGTNVSTTDFSFDGMLTGASPVGHLIATDDFYLYGLAESGGINGSGVLYKYEPFLNEFTKLVDFDNVNGASPTGSLVLHSSGKMYGLTKYGGNSDLGVLFSYDVTSQGYEKLYDFDSINGSFPRGSLMIASDGQLYGLTSEGGAHNDGILFSFNPISNQLTKLVNFESMVSGSNPYGALTEIDLVLSTPTIKVDSPIVIYPNPFQTIIHFQNSQLEAIAIKVFDFSGKMVFEKTTDKNEVTLDLSYLANGIYTLQYESKGIPISTKIIKY